jgi:hypothetical protein
MRTARTRRWSSAAGSNPSSENPPTCISTVLGERNNRSLIAWLHRPSAIRPRSPVPDLSEIRDRALFSPPSEHACDDLGINRRAATPYAVNGVYEVRHVRNPVLEPLIDRLRRLLEELRRVPRLDVLREYEHAHFGVFSTYPLRGKQPLVCSGGRHSDVGDDHVRRLALHEL